jgi:branched-chain amino acid aminotransferase
MCRELSIWGNHARLEQRRRSEASHVPYQPTRSAFRRPLPPSKGHKGKCADHGRCADVDWLGSTAFDGARAFEGVARARPARCAGQLVCRQFRLNPVVDTKTWIVLAREDIAHSAADAERYIRPMYWATGSGGGVLFNPDTTNWCL